VDEFWENIKPRKDYTLHIAAGATAGALILGALLYNPVVDLIHTRQYEAIVAEMTANGAEAGIAKIDELPEARRAEAGQFARDPLIAHFRERAQAAMNELDYPTALKQADRAETYLGDW